VEDTAFYRYVRLLALNEVGSDPGRFAVTPAEFHAANQRRLAERPDTMLATTTHDTKRGEDARMRIAVLSEVGDEWANAAARWRALNHGASALPTPRDEYLIYQSMVGHWPLEDEASFRDRLKDYVLKAVREAKLESSWADPNETYEKTCADFIDRCLDNTAFMAEFRPFAQRIAFLGALASLSQVVLKATVPGVPDFYQGADRWDLSFVDPDNRRPVDFAHRRAVVSAFGGGMSPAELLAQWPNGAIKLYVTERLLSLRRQHPALFARGAYAPLTVGGAKADNIVGFTRSLGGTRLVVVVGRLFTRVATAEPAMQFDWQDTTVELGGLSVPAADLLGNFPAAVLLDQARIL